VTQNIDVSNTAAGVVVGTAPYTGSVINPNLGLCNGVVSIATLFLV
jgi:hypothetical protein